jgi:hypothetical protein
MLCSPDVMYPDVMYPNVLYTTFGRYVCVHYVGVPFRVYWLNCWGFLGGCLELMVRVIGWGSCCSLIGEGVVARG